MNTQKQVNFFNEYEPLIELLIYNPSFLFRSNDEKPVILTDHERGSLEFTCPPRSLQTVVYA